MLRSVDWQFLTDVSGNLLVTSASIKLCLTLEGGIDRSSRNVGT